MRTTEKRRRIKSGNPEVNDLPNVLIFEHTTSHSELIYSQVQFLINYSHKVHLWINNKETGDFNSALITIIDDTKSRINIYTALFKYIIHHRIDVIIFNTAHGIFIRDLSLLLLLSKVKIIGILHQSDRLYKSFTQKIISIKVRNYFVLNDFILKSISPVIEQKKIKIDSFYPIFFPGRFYTKKEAGNTLTFCVPGAIEPERKDYDYLIDFVKKYAVCLDHRIKFLLLGDGSTGTGKKLLNKISADNIGDRFLTFDSFLTNKDFFYQLNNSDFIFPLIHPSGSHFQAFFKTGVSGAFNLALALKKPMLLHKCFESNNDYRNISLFYTEENLFSVFQKITTDPEIITKLELGYTELEKLNFELQALKFNKFLIND
jgi:hypothetical protein